MPGITLALGVVLIAVGLIGYFATGRVSVTALFPAIFGALFAILGVVGQKPGARKIAMHIAAGLALVCVMGTMRGMITLFKHLGGTPAPRPAAAWAQGITAILCLVFVVLCVRSFIAARRNRASAPGFDVVT